jgi:Chaperone of endosialidase
MSYEVSCLKPNVPNVEYTEGVNFMNNVIVRGITAYPDNNSNNQSLTIGASSNLILESKSSMNVHLDPTASLNMYHTNYTDIAGQDVRLESKFLEISASNEATHFISQNSLELHPSDAYKRTKMGSFEVLNTANTQILNTDQDEFKLTKKLVLQGDMSIAGQIYAPNLSALNLYIDNNISSIHHVSDGNVYGNNISLWIDKDDQGTDKATNQIGYGFKINPTTEQLELFKYKRFSEMSNAVINKDGKLLYKKVAQFGFGVQTYDTASDTSAVSSASSIVTTLQTLRAGRCNVDQSGATASGQGYFWNSNVAGSIYHNGFVGINNSNPQVDLDVGGYITAGETVTSKIFTVASDIRVKTDIIDIPSNVCLDKIALLEPKSFKMTPNKQKSGFIAQQVREVIPEAIDIKPNDPLNIQDFHYMDYNTITSYCVGAIKELNIKYIDLNTNFNTHTDTTTRGLLDDKAEREILREEIEFLNNRVKNLESMFVKIRKRFC